MSPAYDCRSRHTGEPLRVAGGPPGVTLTVNHQPTQTVAPADTLGTTSTGTRTEEDTAVGEKGVLHHANRQQIQECPGHSLQDAADRDESRRHDTATTGIALPAMHHHRHSPIQPPGLPRLDYNLWDHRKKLFLMAALLMMEFCLLPVALYYPLWYETTLRHGILFAIITSFFGLVTGVEFALRSWRLLQPAPTYRPIGGRRWGFDATHWILSTVYSIMTALLIGASIPTEPLVRPLALPSTIFLLAMAILLLGTGILHRSGAAARWQLSSTPPGSRIPPLTYILAEDVVAVDGGAGLPYREQLAARYRASWRFRQLLAQLNWAWGVSTLAGGAMTMAVLWTTSRDVAYGFGWAGPPVVVCAMATATLYFVRHRLRREKALWEAERQQC